MAVQASSDQVLKVLQTVFDADFYRMVYPDIAQACADGLRHYVEEGWREGRDPAPWFSTNAYLEAYPDTAGTNPLHHYLTQGWREGRQAWPSAYGADHVWCQADAGHAPVWRFQPPRAPLPAPPKPQPMGPPLEAARALVGEAFDTDFYLWNAPDVAEAGLDPLDHFLTRGWREGRDPRRDFSVRDYLEINPDVAAVDMNPFVHWLVAGRAEGRTPGYDLGFRYQVLQRLESLETRLDHARERAAKVKLRGRKVLAAALAKRRGDKLHMTFSHDDYTVNVGGVQLCLQREAAAFAEAGWDHLHLNPASHWPVVRQPGMSAAIGVVWNGKPVGAFAFDDILAVLTDLGADGARSYAIHNLLGHRPDEVIALLQAVGARRGHLWLHDFTSLCAGYHLMRNEIADCGAPPPDSPSCGLCVYGGWRARQVAAHDQLYRALDLTVAAPSQSTYDLWRTRTTAPADQPSIIAPLATLVPRSTSDSPAEGPLTVAFIGMPSAHKGWPAFQTLAETFADDPRYRFLHLATRPVKEARIPFHEVSVTAKRPRAMIEALEALKVDVAVLWSLCRETFSFTVHEVAASGVAILTRPDSGNIAAFTAEAGRGRVLADEAALMALFETGDALALARSARQPQHFDLAYSRLTADLIEGGAP